MKFSYVIIFKHNLLYIFNRSKIHLNSIIKIRIVTISSKAKSNHHKTNWQPLPPQHIQQNTATLRGRQTRRHRVQPCYENSRKTRGKSRPAKSANVLRHPLRPDNGEYRSRGCLRRRQLSRSRLRHRRFIMARVWCLWIDFSGRRVHRRRLGPSRIRDGSRIALLRGFCNVFGWVFYCFRVGREQNVLTFFAEFFRRGRGG